MTFAFVSCSAPLSCGRPRTGTAAGRASSPSVCRAVISSSSSSSFMSNSFSSSIKLSSSSSSSTPSKQFPTNRFTPRASASSSPTPTPIVPILMGSASDMDFCEKIASALTSLGIESDLRVASAHKVPARLLEVISKYESDGRPKVYIGVAGRSNALSGLLDCAVSAPVISCPPPSSSFGGADIFSSLRMPSGVAPSVILEPATAALFAAKILGLQYPAIKERVSALQRANRDRLYVDDAQSTTRKYMETLGKIRRSGGTMTETSAQAVFGAELAGLGGIAEAVKGKVRDRYEVEIKDSVTGVRENVVALVTTDRQSAFDRVLAAIPCKGAVLNLTSAWWFERTAHIIPNHVLAVPHPYVTLATKCEPFPVEFVVRGYITGSTATSLWKNYSTGAREYCGIAFPDGLNKNEKLEVNVLTPTTKDDAGDRPIAAGDVVKEGLMRQEDWDVCAKAAMSLFEYGQKVAQENGLILVDTKYEFGKDKNGMIRLIDEIHTPDSSRYWIAASYGKRLSEGKEPENVDKEFLRLWFQDNCDPYDDSKGLPQAPGDLVDELGRRYVMLYELITGQEMDLGLVAQGSATMAEALKPYVGSAVRAAGV